MAASVLAPAADRAEDPYVIPRVATFDDDPKSRPEMPVWTSHDVAWLATWGYPYIAEKPWEWTSAP